MLLFLFSLGCTDDKNTDTAEPVVQVNQWCDAVFGGAPGSRAWQQDFASAHVAHRLFGPETDWMAADATLSAQLVGVTDSPDFMPGYADQLPDLCHGASTAAAGCCAAPTMASPPLSTTRAGSWTPCPSSSVMCFTAITSHVPASRHSWPWASGPGWCSRGCCCCPPCWEGRRNTPIYNFIV